jgi:Rieske Fe-S protein
MTDRSEVRGPTSEDSPVDLGAGRLALTRRDFVARSALACAALTSLAHLTSCATGIVHSIAPSPEGRLRLRTADFPELRVVGGVATVHVDGEEAPIFVIRTGERAYLALSSVCTHRGCTVEATVNGFACPCHGSRYGRGGEVVRGPAARDLRRLAAAIGADGTIEVALRTGASV